MPSVAAPRNLVNLESVSKEYGASPVLEGVSLGISAGDHIGVVGRNGDGKSTLLKLIAGLETADTGRVTRTGDLSLALISQGDDLDGERTIREELVGGRADHEWASDSRFRDVLGGLLGGVGFDRFRSGLETRIGSLSGGERRRIALAKLLLDSPELLLLDEPTNHLDVEGVDWLARHLAARRGTFLVVTHDRWFLDAVCTHIWEVGDRTVYQYEGGYSAYVLARAERDRRDALSEDRRQNILRKELAWLRRGPPARTTKPKFRIDAANALIADVPEIRDTVELLRFASSRLGKKVLDAEAVGVTFGDRKLFTDVTLRLGPGDRIAVAGINGSGKTTLIRLLAGALTPTSGEVTRGSTVRLAYLSQEAIELPGNVRVLESLEQVRLATKVEGREVTAANLCERFGFRGAKGRTLVKDLSGGERRRLQLMRLLMDEPNVLILDEPTNDLDIDTLTALEDLLDGWPGTLIVVSHDRYFVERVCDNVYGMTSAGGIRHLPGGIDEYIRLRNEETEGPTPTGTARAPQGTAGAALRTARKDVQRLERQLEKLAERERSLDEEMARNATDHTALRDLQSSRAGLAEQRARLEEEWLTAVEVIEG